VQVIGISPDSPDRLAAFRARDRLPWTSCSSDADHEVLARYGAWGAKQLYGRTVTGVIRSTFVVDPHGRLELARRNVRATGHVGRLLAELGYAG
jgi:peroxiredoxin Q/BCP